MGSYATLSRNHRADLLRLDLLTKHGGVWADATTFCMQPLDDWLPPNLESGFFAFCRPRPERILSSWFLAGEPGNILVSRLFQFMRDYWDRHPYRGDRDQFFGRALAHVLRSSPRTRAWWFSRPVRDWLAISPYYAIHFGFEKLIREDPECARIWDCTPKVSAVPPHRLYRAGLLSPISPKIRSEIDRRKVPVYKTTWDIREQAIPSDSVLGYLLDD